MSCKLLTISSRDHDMTQLLSLMFLDVFHIIFSVVAFERTGNVHQFWWEINLTRSLPQTALLITKLIHNTHIHHITALPRPHNMSWAQLALAAYHAVWFLLCILTFPKNYHYYFHSHHSPRLLSGSPLRFNTDVVDTCSTQCLPTN